MSAKKWVKIWLIIIISILPFVGILNYIIDPYGIFNNLFKKYIKRDRISSSINLTNNTYNTIIIGTSRTQGGINTENKLFKNNTINVSMSGSNIFEIYKVFNKIYKTQDDGTTIIYGVDFFTFSDKRMLNLEFHKSLYNPKVKKVNLYGSLLLSIDAIRDSKETLLKNIYHKPANNINGYLNKNYNKNYNYENAFKKILVNNFLVKDSTYGCYNYSNDRLKLFKEIIKNSKHKKLNLFITPLHHRHIFALIHLGLFETYLNWIRDIHSIVKKYNSKEYNIKLFDFSYINEVTSEAVSKYSKYYWESSHYKSIVGNKIINRIYETDTTFGVLLNNIDIDLYLKKYIKDYNSFILKNKSTFLDIYTLYQETTEKRLKNCSEHNNVQTILSREKNYNPLIDYK